jgi:serpin B
MMRQEAVFGYAEDEGLQVLEVPYVGNELSMVFFLPKACGGWRDFEKKISAKDLARWTQGLHHFPVNVIIPRFQFRASFSLAWILATMGMADAFKPDQADFSGMTPEKPLGISTVVHQAGVEVDEAGTTAFAATLKIICLGHPPVFRADHPFIFMIRDIPLDAILFMGRVLNPAA